MIIELTSKQLQTVLGWIGCGNSVQFEAYLNYLRVIDNTFYVYAAINLDVKASPDIAEGFKFTLREGLDVDFDDFINFDMLEEVKRYALKAEIVKRATSNRTAGSLVLLTLKELIQLSKSKEDASSMEKSFHQFLISHSLGSVGNVKIIKDGKGMGIILEPTLETILERAAIEDHEVCKMNREITFFLKD